MGFERDLDDFFEKMEVYSKAYDVRTEDDYSYIIEICKGAIVLACREHATHGHRNYSGRIRKTLRYMQALFPAAYEDDEEFLIGDVSVDEYSKWECYSHCLASVLINSREERKQQPKSASEFRGFILDYSEELRFRNTTDVIEGWTAVLERNAGR